MKWFKHISDSLDDPFIQDLIDEFGSDGYIVFFGTIEMMAREFDVKTPGIVRLSRRFIRRKLRLSWQKISTIYELCQKEGRFFIEDDGTKVTINCPKLKEMCDDWTQRLLRSSSEVASEKLQTEVEKEVEVEKEKKKALKAFMSYLKKLNAKPKENLPVPIPKKTLFDQFWEIYPKKTGKQSAVRAWKTHVKNNEETVRSISKALRWQVVSEQWTKDAGQYIPNPTTYLNQHRWEDEPTTPYEAENAQSYDSPEIKAELYAMHQEKLRKQAEKQAEREERRNAIDAEVVEDE